MCWLWGWHRGLMHGKLPSHCASNQNPPWLWWACRAPLQVMCGPSGTSGEIVYCQEEDSCVIPSPLIMLLARSRLIRRGKWKPKLWIQCLKQQGRGPQRILAGVKMKILGYTLAPQLPQCAKRLVPNVTTLALLEISWSSFDDQPVKCHCLQAQAGCVATAICKPCLLAVWGSVFFYFNLTFSSNCDKLSLGDQMGK